MYLYRGMVFFRSGVTRECLITRKVPVDRERFTTVFIIRRIVAETCLGGRWQWRSQVVWGSALPSPLPRQKKKKKKWEKEKREKQKIIKKRKKERKRMSEWERGYKQFQNWCFSHWIKKASEWRCLQIPSTTLVYIGNRVNQWNNFWC